MNEYTGPVAAAKVADAAPAPEASAEAYPDAAAILRDAGWRPHPEWGVYTRATLVMGQQPDGAAFHVKDWAMIKPGHPNYGPDTPDTAEEAAQWLVVRFAPEPAPPPEPEPEPEPQELGAELLEVQGELGESADIALTEDTHPHDGGDHEPGGENPASEPAQEAGFALEAPDPIDADYSELPALEGQDVAAEPADAGGSQFIFGDNLDQMRTAAIGLVMRHARALTPSWALEDDAALIELRNFTMGVSEGRWPDDAGRRAELDTLEGTLARINAIARARDEKVEFLEGASREEVEGFDPEADWP